jgi:hypothetical protein
MRTTISLPATMMRKIRDIGHRRHRTLTCTIQEIIARGLETEEHHAQVPSPFRDSPTIKGGALIDYTDKEALSKLFDKYP